MITFTRTFEDENEFNQFARDLADVHKWKDAIWDLDQKLRANHKYIAEPRVIAEDEIWFEARQLLNEFLNSRDLKLYE